MTSKPFGRPTKYRTHFCQDLMDYIEVNPYENMFKPPTAEPQRTPKFPTIQAFANSIGVCMDTIKNWERKHADFFGTVKKAECYQAQYLIEAASAGFIDRGFSVFMAKNLTEWNDRGKADFVNNPFAELEKTSDRIEKVLSDVSRGLLSMDQGTKLMGMIRTQIDVDIEAIKAKQNQLEKRLDNESKRTG